jgi:hypothetical protein
MLEWMLAMSFVVLAFTVICYFAPDVKEQRWLLDHPRLCSGRTALGRRFCHVAGYLHFSIPTARPMAPSVP